MRMLRMLALALALREAPAIAGEDGVRLRYALERLGNAQGVTLTAPGAAGTAFAFGLTYSLGSWSRFNWPLFEPVPGTAEVRFWVRREGAEPETVLCRLLTEDGIEWQSNPIPLGETWREISLQAADFAWFRGGAGADAAGALDLGRAQQFQVVPATRPGEGAGTVLLDEIRFLPAGPAWTAEAAEQLPRRDAAELEYERLCDLLGRWRAEEDRLAAETERTTRWLAELNALPAEWADAGQRAALQRRLQSRSFAWQRAPPLCREPAAEVPFSLDEYRRRVAAVETPPAPLLDLRQNPALSVSRLYGAVEQDSPAIVTVDGQAVLRHRVRFTSEPVRQTVFTEIGLPAPTDLSGRRLLLRMRCTEAALNAETPFLLRLRTDAGGAESWADLTPSCLPGPVWQDVLFDTAGPLRQSRANPAATLTIALRFENRPGTGAEFDVEVATLHILSPEPAATVRRQALRAAESRLAVARDRLGALRDQAAQAQDALRSTPELWALYLTSFEEPSPWVATAPAAPAPPVADPLAGLALPPGPLRPARFAVQSLPAPEGPEIRVRAVGLPPDAELAASLLGPEGTILAAARAATETLSLRVRALDPWAPGRPSRYRLRLAAVAGGAVLAFDDREIGVRTSAVVPAGPTPLLRHVTRPRQPDWTFLLNGRCWFPRMSVYHWPEPDRTEKAGVRMLGDLWVDGLRFYGFSANPDVWERFDRCGLSMLSGLAPGYRSLTGWEDVPAWADGYRFALRRALPLSDRPSQVVAQVGNEVELASWGARIGAAFPDAPYQPLDCAAALLRREWDPPIPIMYVRAGTFREIPPLPHEQVCGINQYTGRYSGRIDEIDRDLAELARWSLWADRPLMITEWMGPKYSWATGGIGGVSPRGAAYFLERYWRALAGTPGIVGSTEFTLNWVIGPFEDLTNQTREEAWKNRPPHTAFGGGHTADHIPIVAPDAADTGGTCFRAMQAFQSPLYVMAGTPGTITLWGEDAEQLAAALVPAGIAATLSPSAAEPDPSRASGHLVQLRAPQPALFPHGAVEPLVRTVLNPARPDLLVATLEAPTPEARSRGLARLIDAATALGGLRQAEGAMTRALVLTDPGSVQAYAAYLLEFAGRGYLFSGDDVRTTLNRAELIGEDGRRRPAWELLGAIILDTARPLREDESALVEELARSGANVLITARCHAASPGLRNLLPATLKPCGTLAEHVPAAEALRRPLFLRDLGGVDLDRIRRFRPDLAASPALTLFGIEAEGAETLAATASGTPVLVHKPLDRGHLFLLGADLGPAVEVHRRVTHAGQTHPLYDRDTACGLERLSRAAVNLCRFGCPDKRLRPHLALRVIPERTQTTLGEPLRATVLLSDPQGAPVAGQVRARVRVLHGGRPGPAGAYVDIMVPESGAAPLLVRPGSGSGETEPGPSGTAGLTYEVPEPAGVPLVVSVQVKAYAYGRIPADGAVAFVLGGSPPHTP